MELLGIEQTLKQFFVALYVQVRYPDGKEPWDIWSGFIVERNRRWLGVTCGHAGVDMAKAKAAGGQIIRFGFQKLGSADGEFSDLTQVSPDHVGGHIDKDGVDVGYILLSDLTVGNLRACGVKPVPEGALAPANRDFDQYLLTGVLRETAEETGQVARLGLAAQTMRVASVWFPLTNKQIDETEKVKRLKFDFTLDGLEVNGRPITSLVGLSGGPVVGCNRLGDKVGAMMLVGIQSAWLEKSKQVLVCPATPLINSIWQEIERSKEGIE